jgi:endonuclease-8
MARTAAGTAARDTGAMPEGPSLVILREDSAAFVGQTIVHASGNARAIDIASLPGQAIVDLRTWGKHFLIVLPQVTLRVHFLLFGSYRINERKSTPPRLALGFADGSELNFYACQIKPADLDGYDWRADVMSPAWDPALARRRLRAAPELLACDALLDQDIFAGVGNIIKNEVLFRLRLHPLTRIGALPAPKLRALVEQAHGYSFEFLAWKRAFTLKQHWLAHTKSICPRCRIPFRKGKLGRTQRRSFYCERCQKLYI